MINYDRTGYEIKRDLTIFPGEISYGLSRPKSKFIMQMIYGKVKNIMDVANKYKWNYHIDFMDKHGKKIECKTSYIPVDLCKYTDQKIWGNSNAG